MMAQHALASAHADLPLADLSSWTTKLKQQIERFPAWINACYDRSAQRQELNTLSPRMLLDIGVTSEQVKLEVKKPFWV